MVMASLGAVIYEDVADPGSLNSYFQVRRDPPRMACFPALTCGHRIAQRHGCYYCAAGDCNNLRLDCWALLDLTDRLQFEGEIQAPPRQELVANVTQGISAVIGARARSWGTAAAALTHTPRRAAHVHHSGHFVLLVDWDPASDSFEVHDPFYNSTHYPYANISDVIVYRYTTPVRSPVVPHKYPAFKQCSQPWAEDVMVRGLPGNLAAPAPKPTSLSLQSQENSTVCREGCLMSSTAMSLARNGIHPDGHPADPGTLNQWLRRNGGCVPRIPTLRCVDVPLQLCERHERLERDRGDRAGPRPRVLARRLEHAPNQRPFA